MVLQEGMSHFTWLNEGSSGPRRLCNLCGKIRLADKDPTRIECMRLKEGPHAIETSHLLLRQPTLPRSGAIGRGPSGFRLPSRIGGRRSPPPSRPVGGRVGGTVGFPDGATARQGVRTRRRTPPIQFAAARASLARCWSSHPSRDGQQREPAGNGAPRRSARGRSRGNAPSRKRNTPD